MTDGQRTFLTLLQSQGPAASGVLDGGSIPAPPTAPVVKIPDATAHGAIAIAWKSNGHGITTAPWSKAGGTARALVWSSVGAASQPVSSGVGSLRLAWSSNGSALDDRRDIMEKIKRIDEQTIMFLMVDRWRSERARHTMYGKRKAAR